MNGDDWERVFTLTYAWIEAGHVIFVIFWIAGLFLLPRYYIYHQESPAGSDEEGRWIERERKLRMIILNPSMVLVWIFGVSLATIGNLWGEAWLQAKFIVVLGLSGYHGWMVGYGKKLARGQRPASGTTLRLMNELPGIATAIIVILVIVRPF